MELVVTVALCYVLNEVQESQLLGHTQCLHQLIPHRAVQGVIKRPILEKKKNTILSENYYSFPPLKQFTSKIGLMLLERCPMMNPCMASRREERLNHL